MQSQKYLSFLPYVFYRWILEWQWFHAEYSSAKWFALLSFCASQQFGRVQGFQTGLLPLSKRCPGLHFNSIFIHSLLCYCLLVEGMGFYLVNHRLHTAKGGYIYQSVRIKIWNTNCTQSSVIIEIFQCLICPIVIRKRLMEENKIQIICSQFPHGFQNRFFRLLISIMFNPNLCCKKNIFSGNTWFDNGIPNLFLVEIFIRW